MKKLALFLFGIGCLTTIGMSAANSYDSSIEVPIEQMPCYQAPCSPDTVCNPAPCYPAPCQPDTVCNPAPCYPGC